MNELPFGKPDAMWKTSSRWPDPCVCSITAGAHATASRGEKTRNLRLELACVVGQAAHDGGVKHQPVGAAVRLQQPEQLLQLLCRLRQIIQESK